MSRNDATRALAKVMAYLAVGKVAEARAWAAPLIEWLQGI